MKLLSLFLAIGYLSCAQSQGVPAIIQDAVIWIVRTFCELTTQVDHSIVLAVRGGDFTTQDAKMKQYAFCVYQALFLTTADGNVNKEVGLKIIPAQTDPVKFAATVDACSSETGATVVDKFWNGLVCYSKGYPGDIFAL